MNDIVVVDDGQIYETTESAIVAKEEADRAEKWAKYSEAQAGLSANSALEAAQSRDAAAASAKFAADTVNGFDTHAAEKQSAFDTNAQQKINDYNSNATAKTDAFNQNAAEKQAQVDASAAAAKQSETNAANSADLAESWAIGDKSSRPEGSAKWWADQASKGQKQADWNQTDNTQVDFIKNKPDVVHKTGNEEISGIKTFKDITIWDTTHPTPITFLVDDDQEVAPKEDISRLILLYKTKKHPDQKDGVCSWIRTARGKDKSSYSGLYTRNILFGDTEKIAYVAPTILSTGDAVTKVTQPPISAKGDIAATVEWVRKATMPDYSRPLDKGNIQSGYTAKMDGWITGYHEGLYNAGFIGYINGKMLLSGHRGLGYGGAYQDFILPMSKGDVFTFSGVESDVFRQTFTFYPNKGA